MGCNCGGKKTVTDYQVTLRHDGSTQTVTSEGGGLAAVRQLLAKSPQGGTYKAVPRAT
ncbi:hypothetical protein L1085_009655 [Streptomyces sp. MSC1_001]|jgi:hypothetical protein|uniref:hypothetical protein n=1 Tax=Streptomyces sp. MSC1_001 TaxID=2909263 RepID=UPI00202F5E40|nr:hypothetical protein [Streptomyces sp. MSC1_001]